VALDTSGPRPAWVPLLERAASGLGLGAHAPAASLARIAEYLDHLVRWNQKTDLTAARSAEELVDLSLADALVLASHGTPGSGAGRGAAGVQTWVDVGSGAGAPGLVLALLCPSLTVTLVEPRDKRVAFLRSVAGSLSISNVSVVRGRSDSLSPHAWDVAVARATLPPPDWLREGVRLSRRAVWVLLARDEPPALDGVRVDVDQRYEWPLTGSGRRAVRYVPVEEHTRD